MELRAKKVNLLPALNVKWALSLTRALAMPIAGRKVQAMLFAKMERVNVLLGMCSEIILRAFATLSVIQTRPQGRRISVIVQVKLVMDTLINVADVARVTIAAVTARTVIQTVTAKRLL
jgi:hypothetical protein